MSTETKVKIGEKNINKVDEKNINKGEERIIFMNLCNVIKNINDNKLFLSLSIGTSKEDQKCITEFGWCIFPKKGQIKKKKHVIVQENLKFNRNGETLPDNAEVQELNNIKQELHKDIEEINYIIGYKINDSLDLLATLGIFDVNNSKFILMKDDKTPEYGIIESYDISNSHVLDKNLRKLIQNNNNNNNSGIDALINAKLITIVSYNIMIKLVNTIRSNVSDKKLFLCIDIKPCEQNKDNIEEIGWCVFSKIDSATKNKHFIVKENIVNDNENHNLEENKFHFGETRILELNEICEELKKDLEDVNYILSRRVEDDIYHLNKINIDISKYDIMKDLKTKEYGIIDLNDIYTGVYYIDTISLDEGLKRSKIKYDNLKNPGNNVNYIMENFKTIINQENSEKYDEYRELIKNIREKISNDLLFLCLDIEAFEYNQEKLTEFGWCIFKKDGTIKKTIHALVKENLRLRNRKHVPDNKDYYLFGKSVIQNIKDIEKELKQDIENVNYLVGQGIGSDLRYLNKIKVNTSKFEKMKGSKIPEFGVIDTMDLYSGYYFTKGVGLEKSLIKLELPYGRLHNAANDAIFTMQVFMKIINESKTVPLQLSPQRAEEIKKDEMNNVSKPNRNRSNFQRYQRKPYNKRNGNFKNDPLNISQQKINGRHIESKDTNESNYNSQINRSKKNRGGNRKI